MKVKYRGKTYEFEKGMKVSELLKKLDLQPQSTIVIRNEEVLTEDIFIGPEDNVEILNAISGGQ